jgi:hypothetical protein
MVRFLTSIGLVLSLFAATAALSAGTPPQLMGKSVHISWTDSRVERRDDGSELPMTQTSRVKLYVSDKGRIFSQFDRSASVAGQSRQDLDVSGGGNAVLNFHAEGNHLVADQISAGGARRVTITFDPSFTNCSINVVNGASGRRTRHLNLAKTGWLELVSIAVTSTSCSVATGNAFGN